MPPNRNTAANSGSADRISSSMNATDATSLPHTMPTAVIRLTSSTSNVCRSRSPLMAPAASAGANRQASESWMNASAAKTDAPIWAEPVVRWLGPSTVAVTNDA